MTEGGEKEEWRVHPPFVISLFLLLGRTLTESKRRGESETEKECIHVCERKRTSLNNCTHIHQHDKNRSCCIHGLLSYVVARYVSGASGVVARLVSFCFEFY